MNIKSSFAQLQINTPRGLHATPACMLAQTTMKFKSRIKLHYKDDVINCKSLVHVVSLGVKTGETIQVFAVGDDAEEAVAALRNLVEVRNFDGE